MDTKKELQLAYGLLIVFFIAGVISYVAFSAPHPDNPYRFVFTSQAGKVFFTHDAHMDDYGLECIDCHHTLDEGEQDPQPESCSECHYPGSEDDGVPTRPDAFHKQCIECHQDNGSGPVECGQCHAMGH